MIIDGVIRALAGTVALMLLASACGASRARHTAGPSQPSPALAFSLCMRSHGVTAFPDPNGSGAIPKETLQQLGVGSAGFHAAQSACRHLLPNGGRPPSRAAQQRVAALSLAFARCVRAHGVPRFPDPDSTGRIPDPASVGIDQGAPKFQAANEDCAKDRPPYIPSNAAYDAWARTHPGGS